MLGLDWNLKGRFFKKNPSRRGLSAARVHHRWRWPWNLEWCCVTWQAATGSSETAALCIQATKSEKCQGGFFTVFHMQRGQEEGVRSPTLLLRQGRRQTGPPSSECEFQGSDARGRLLVLSFGRLTRVQRSPRLKQQTLVHLLRKPPWKKEINEWASRSCA